MSMPTAPPPPPTTNSAGSYSFISYPTEYPFSPSPHPTMALTPIGPPPMPIMDHHHHNHSHAHSPHCCPAMYHSSHLTGAGAPPSPMMHHALPGLPPSPISPARGDGSDHDGRRERREREKERERERERERIQEREDAKVMRHLLNAMAKMQNTIKDLSERQEQILDRMSLMEQRVGRINDTIDTLIENTEIVLDDNKAIRARVEDTEIQDAFETRITDMMDNVVSKLITAVGSEMKDIKKAVRISTENQAKFIQAFQQSGVAVTTTMAVGGPGPVHGKSRHGHKQVVAHGRRQSEGAGLNGVGGGGGSGSGDEWVEQVEMEARRAADRRLLMQLEEQEGVGEL